MDNDSTASALLSQQYAAILCNIKEPQSTRSTRYYSANTRGRNGPERCDRTGVAGCEPDLILRRHPGETLGARKSTRDNTCMSGEVNDYDFTSIIPHFRMVYESDSISFWREAGTTYPATRDKQFFPRWVFQAEMLPGISDNCETRAVGRPSHR